MSARRFLPILAAALASLALATALTWPLAARIGVSVPQGDHDLWQNYWNIWWWDRQAAAGASPYKTDLLFHPEGASLGWHTHSPANTIPLLPVVHAARALGLDGPAAALGVATLAGFALACLGGCLLAREIVGRTGPALLAGLVFAFFPQHVEQSLEHLNLESIWAMPFALLYLLRTARGGGPVSWAAAGLFLGVNALLSWHNGLLLFLLAPAVCLAGLRQAPSKGRALLGLGLAGALAAAICLPFIWPMVAEAARGEGGFKQSVHKPIDPLFLLVPHSGHPIWGGLVAGLYARLRAYPAMGFTAYLGIVAVGLAVAAKLWKAPGGERQRTFLFWSLLLLAHVVLAMGHHPLIARQEITWIQLPFALLDQVPLLKAVRVANRFLVPAALCLSVLAAMGAAALADASRGPRRSRLVPWALGALLVLDYLWVPFPLREIPRPAYLEALAQQPPGLAVLDIPTGSGPRASLDMFAQTRHGRPIAGGYLSKEPPGIRRTLQEHPILWPIFKAHPEPLPPGNRETLAEAVRALKVGLVVVHLDRDQGRLIARRDALQTERPWDLYAPRLVDPEKGIFPGDLERCRKDLAEGFGPPVWADEDTEIFVVR